MRQIWSIGFALSFALALGFPLSSFAKTLVYCSEGSPSSFNPQLSTDGPSFNASSRILYNALVEFEPGGVEVRPALAESWKISNDGLTFTFNLRKGVKFHSRGDFTPKRDFRAEDVIFTFDRMRLKSHPFHLVSGGTYEYFRSMEMDKIIKDVIKVDDYTVKFVLAKPEAPFLANLAMDYASILSAEYGEHLLKKKTPEKMDNDPIGTGPYIFKSYQKDTMIRYDANKEFFRGAPKIDKIVIAITVDPNVRFQKLKAGECQLIAEPAPSDIAAMKKHPKMQVISGPGLNLGYLAMNTSKPPFDKKEVRQAINHALNKASYIKAIYMDLAQVANNPIPPSMWSYNDAIKDYEYSIDKAKKLLASAGYPNGFETELWTLPVSRPYNPNGKKMGELMQADLAKVGIKVKLISYDWPTYLAKSRKGEHAMAQFGWTGDNGDPDNFLNVLLGCAAVKSGSNLSRWCNQKFEDLVEKGKITTDKAKRTKFYEEAQVIFKEEAPWVPLAHAVVHRTMTKSVKGYKLSPFGTENFSILDLE